MAVAAVVSFLSLLDMEVEFLAQDRVPEHKRDRLRQVRDCSEVKSDLNEVVGL